LSSNATCNVSLLQLPASAKSIKQPFSESDILYLHNIFLTHGSHAIRVNNVAQGRTIIAAVLQSLNYYSAVACLSLSDQALENSIFDISYALTLGGYLTNHNSEIRLEEFFLDQFDVDFMWVEATQELIHQPWFESFMHHLELLKFEHHMPIIVVFYED